MKLSDYSELFFGLSVTLFFIIILAVASVVFPRFGRGISRRTLLAMIDDYKQHRLVAGGLVGLLINLFVIAVVFLVLSGLFKLMSLV